MVTKMNVVVRHDTCIGSANRSAVAPEIVDHDQTGVAFVRPVHDVVDETRALLDAVELCPVGAVVVSAGGAA